MDLNARRRCVIEGVRAYGSDGKQQEIITPDSAATGVVRGRPGGFEFHQYVREFVFDGPGTSRSAARIVHGPWRSRRSFPALGGGAVTCSTASPAAPKIEYRLDAGTSRRRRYRRGGQGVVEGERREVAGLVERGEARRWPPPACDSTKRTVRRRHRCRGAPGAGGRRRRR